MKVPDSLLPCQDLIVKKLICKILHLLANLALFSRSQRLVTDGTVTDLGKPSQGKTKIKAEKLPIDWITVT